MFAFSPQLSSVVLLVLLAAMASAVPAPQQEVPHALLDIETPNQFNYSPSPLAQPDSLRSKPYFDFLSTLYAHDTAKSNLFRPYSRQRREADAVAAVEARKLDRPRRAIVFRPLFVYRQQEIRREELKERKDAQRRHDLNRLYRL